MTAKNLISRLLFILLCLAFAGGTVYFLIVMENEKIEIKAQMEKLALSKKGLASVVTYMEESQAGLERKLKESERAIDKLTSQYEGERRKTAEVDSKIKEKDAELKKVKAVIEEYKQEKKGLNKQLQLLNAAFNEIKAEYDEVSEAREASEIEIEELDRMLKDLSRIDSTSLGTVVIR
ncbi:MAG: hypothetical protein NG740_06325 [Omnitrophica bacterium]|nr:hypothetical protein [Candidatus Omnitrophota bacterium]